MRIKDDLAKLMEILEKTEVIKPCSTKKMNSKKRFYKLTNLTVFAVVFKDIPMSFKDAGSPKALLKKTVNWPIYEEKLRKL